MILVILACLASSPDQGRTFEFPSAIEDQRACVMQGMMTAPQLMRPHPDYLIVAVGCGKREVKA